MEDHRCCPSVSTRPNMPTPEHKHHRYTLTIQLTRFQDWWAGTSYTHFMNHHYQNISLWKVCRGVCAWLVDGTMGSD